MLAAGMATSSVATARSCCIPSTSGRSHLMNSGASSALGRSGTPRWQPSVRPAARQRQVLASDPYCHVIKPKTYITSVTAYGVCGQVFTCATRLQCLHAHQTGSCPADCLTLTLGRTSRHWCSQLFFCGRRGCAIRAIAEPAQRPQGSSSAPVGSVQVSCVPHPCNETYDLLAAALSLIQNPPA